MLLEASIGPKRSRGTRICQGNLVEARAKLRPAGTAMARSQRMVFHFNMLFFSEVVIVSLKIYGAFTAVRWIVAAGGKIGHKELRMKNEE